jgi:hypothetical protein
MARISSRDTLGSGRGIRMTSRPSLTAASRSGSNSSSSWPFLIARSCASDGSWGAPSACQTAWLDADGHVRIAGVGGVLVVGVAPHEHGDALATVEAGERVHFLGHASVALVEAVHGPGVARLDREPGVAQAAQHAVSVQDRLLHALRREEAPRASKKRSPSK